MGLSREHSCPWPAPHPSTKLLCNIAHKQTNKQMDPGWKHNLFGGANKWTTKFIWNPIQNEPISMWWLIDVHFYQSLNLCSIYFPACTRTTVATCAWSSSRPRKRTLAGTLCRPRMMQASSPALRASTSTVSVDSSTLTVHRFKSFAFYSWPLWPLVLSSVAAAQPPQAQEGASLHQSIRRTDRERPGREGCLLPRLQPAAPRWPGGERRPVEDHRPAARSWPWEPPPPPWKLPSLPALLKQILYNCEMQAQNYRGSVGGVIWGSGSFSSVFIIWHNPLCYRIHLSFPPPPHASFDQPDLENDWSVLPREETKIFSLTNCTVDSVLQTVSCWSASRFCKH